MSFSKTDLSVLETKGIKENRSKNFSINIYGADLYSLLQILEGLAVDSSSYLTVRSCVKLSDAIRDQARTQGF